MTAKLLHQPSVGVLSVEVVRVTGVQQVLNEHVHDQEAAENEHHDPRHQRTASIESSASR